MNTDAPIKNVVLTKALQKVAHYLALSEIDVSEIIGSEVNANDLDQIGKIQKNDSMQAERNLLLIDIAKKLDSLCGGDEIWARRFIYSYNKVLACTPIQKMKSLDGLKDVASLLSKLNQH